MEKPKFFYLETCKTCQKILAELEGGDMDLREIKSKNVTLNELEAMRKRTDTYESLFSRRAMKFRSLGLNEKELSEEDYRDWILKEYTFLKRPVLLTDDAVYAGNSKKAVSGMKEALGLS